MKIPVKWTLVACLLHLAMTPSADGLKVRSQGSLLNDPAREVELMDWGLGMFVHWSHDSQLGSVISHRMVGASEKHLDRYINELPKTYKARE